MRRYIAETSYADRTGVLMQVVTVYPSTYNKKQVERDIGVLSAKKMLLVSEKDNWRIEDVK